MLVAGALPQNPLRNLLTMGNNLQTQCLAGRQEPSLTALCLYCFYAQKQLLLSACLSHRNSVRPSVTQVDQSKTMQARFTKSSPSAAWKTLVSGTVKLFHKFEGSPRTRALNDRRWAKFTIFGQ